MINTFIKIFKEDLSVISVFLTVVMSILLIISMCSIDSEIKKIYSKLSTNGSEVVSKEQKCSKSNSVNIEKHINKLVSIAYYEFDSDTLPHSIQGTILRLDKDREGHPSVFIKKGNGAYRFVKIKSIVHIERYHKDVCFISIVSGYL